MKRESCALIFASLFLLVGEPTLADDVTSSVYMRTDSDGTQVISPHVGVQLDLGEGETQIDLGYSMDIWTSASIDIRTAATRPVTEQRDEIRVGVSHERSDTRLVGSYRYSTELDYQSHGGSVTVQRRLAGGSADISGTAFAASDTVGRSGDNDFARDIATLGGRVTFSQILDPRSVVMATYEFTRREGYQSSPYRYVGLGGDGICAGSAVFCLPEVHPDIRLRHAAVVRGRRAIGDDHSLGVDYRFYIDSWGILSHTATMQWGYNPNADTTLRAKYRFYQQGAADFYRAIYTDAETAPDHRTRDRELSPMRHHRLALSAEYEFEFTDSGPTTRLTLGLGGSLLQYADFVGLDQIYAIDLVLAGVVDL